MIEPCDFVRNRFKKFIETYPEDLRFRVGPGNCLGLMQEMYEAGAAKEVKMILIELQKLITESIEIIKAQGVEPKYIIMGEEVYENFKKETKKCMLPDVLTGDIMSAFGLDIIVDEIQKNTIYILDEENGKRIYETNKFLRLLKIVYKNNNLTSNTKVYK